MAAITSIVVRSMHESCERTTFYVMLISDEGFDMTAASHRTGSIYTNHEGLSIEEARDRALIDAANWGDFLQIEVEPFRDAQGNTIEPSMTFDSYTMRREMEADRADKLPAKG